MTTQLTRDDARAIARILYVVHQRRAARLAAEQADKPADEQGAEPRKAVVGSA